MRVGARLVASLAVVALAGSGLWWGWKRREFVLPTQLHVERVVHDLSSTLDLVTATEGDVRAGGLQPSPYLDGPGGYRRGIVVPPPSLLRYRLHVPTGGALRLAAGVARDAGSTRDAAGIRFVARVDGREMLSRVINPARTRHDRRWFEERIDLGFAAGRDVEVTLATEPAASGPLAGTPAWSNVRLVEEASRARQVATPHAPSVLILVVDALRADHLGCYGATPSPSPTFDAVAARGLVFEHAIAQSSWTMPAVTTILTGLYPRTHGVVGGSWEWGKPPGVAADADWAFLSDSIPTLAETAELDGITTVGVVGNPTISRGTNIARGFETFVELPGDEHTRWPRAADINATFTRWLGRNRGVRFLGYLHYMEAHSPYAPPAPFRPGLPAAALRPEVRQGAVDRLQHAVRCGAPPLGADEIAYLRALYDGGIRYWDAELARLLAALADQGVRDSTVVVVTADHGEEFQDHGHLEHGSHLYDETIHIPLVLAGTGIAPGRVSDQAEQIDLFPTAAGLLGLSALPPLPGRPLLGARPARPVFSDTRYAAGPDCADMQLLSLRTDGWKLVHAPSLGRFQLFDLRTDPGEHDDRYASAPEAAGLAAQLTAWWDATPPPPPPGGHDPRLFDKLRALGYVQ